MFCETAGVPYVNSGRVSKQACVHVVSRRFFAEPRLQLGRHKAIMLLRNLEFIGCNVKQFGKNDCVVY